MATIQRISYDFQSKFQQSTQNPFPPQQQWLVSAAFLDDQINTRTSHTEIVVDFSWVETLNQNGWQIDMHRIAHIASNRRDVFGYFAWLRHKFTNKQ